MKKLSEREAQCVRLIADGHTDKSAGKKLAIGSRTIRFHIQNACAKLNAKTRAQLVALAIQRGEISVEA